MTGHRCRCGAEIFYNNVKEKEVECPACNQGYTVDKNGDLKEIIQIEEIDLSKRDPFGEK